MTSLTLIGQSLFLIKSIVQVLLSQRLHRKLQSSGGDHPLVHESELALGNGVVIFLAIVGILGIIGSGTEIFVQIFPQAYLLNLIAQLAEFLLPRVLFFFLMMVIERVWLDLRSRGAIAVAYLITAVVGQSDIYNWYYLFDFSNADFYTALTWIALIFPYAFASFMGIILYRRGVPHRAIVSVIATLALFWVLPVVVDSAIYHLGPFVYVPPSDNTLLWASVVKAGSAITASALLSFVTPGILKFRGISIKCGEGHKVLELAGKGSAIVLLIELGLYLTLPVLVLQGMSSRSVFAIFYASTTLYPGIQVLPATPLVIEFLDPYWAAGYWRRWMVFVVGPIVSLVIGIASVAIQVKARRKGLPAPAWALRVLKGVATSTFIYCCVYGVGFNTIYGMVGLHTMATWAFLVIVPLAYYHITILFRQRHPFRLSILLLFAPLLGYLGMLGV